MDEATVQALFAEERRSIDWLELAIDLSERRVRSPSGEHTFSISERHRDMFLRQQDLIGATLDLKDQIDTFAERHWRSQPRIRDVGSKVRMQLLRGDPQTSKPL